MSPTAGGSGGRGYRQRFRDALRRRIAIDRRALAAFRIALAALLLLNLATRARHFTALHTDRGIVPAAALTDAVGGTSAVAAAVGEPWLQVLLFPVAAVAALALLVGYRSRTAAVLSYALLVLLHGRNPIVLNSGDALLIFLLFWAVFLPIGERWAFDARRVDRDRTTVASVATAGVLVQVLLVYLVNASHKVESDLWLSGEAVAAVFQADHLTIFLGNVLAEFPAVLTGFGSLWMALLLGSPLLVLTTGYARAVLVTLFVGMHAGMVLTMPIGLFPGVSITGLLLLYPPVFWDAAASLAGRSAALRRARDRIAGLTARVPTPGGLLALPEGPRIERVRSIARTGLLAVVPAVALCLLVLSAMGTTGIAEPPDAAATAIAATDMEQDWRMFAPSPARTTRWYAAPANRTDGTTVDALRGGPPTLERPDRPADAVPSFRWRKALQSVRTTEDPPYRSYLANYLCDRYDRTHEGALERVTLYHGYERVDFRTGEVEAAGGRTLLEYDCDGPLVQSG